MSVAIDTLAYARRLRDAGFTEQQAEGQAEALAAAMTDTLATKQDLRELDSRMDARFAALDARFANVDGRFTRVDDRFGLLELRIEEMEKRMVLRLDQQSAAFDSKLDSRLAALEHRMTLRLGGMMVAGVGFLSALIKLG